MFLIERHGFGVQFLAVALVLLLQLLQFRLQGLHRRHRADLVDGQRRQHHVDREREGDDRQPVGRDDGVEALEDVRDQLEHPVSIAPAR